jgi:hypothetical protein
MNLKITYQTNPGLSRPVVAIAAADLGYWVLNSTDDTMTFQGSDDQLTVEDFKNLTDILPTAYITNLEIV